jgi:hypothetical protein
MATPEPQTAHDAHWLHGPSLNQIGRYRLSVNYLYGILQTNWLHTFTVSLQIGDVQMPIL